MLISPTYILYHETNSLSKSRQSEVCLNLFGVRSAFTWKAENPKYRFKFKNSEIILNMLIKISNLDENIV